MMGYAVGVDFGSVLSTAGIVRWDNDFPSNPESSRVVGPVPSVVYVNSDNRIVVGNPARQRGEIDPQRVIRDFKRRLGDPIPIMVGEWTGQTESIVAEVIRHIIAGIATEEGCPPDAIAVTHPAGWGTYKQELLAGALARAGLADVLLVTEPKAAATNTTRFGTCAGRTVVVYDLGGGSFEATVMVRVGDSEFTMAGHSQVLDWLGGSDFDQAIFSRVRRAAGLTVVDVTDQAAIASLGRLRRDCTSAKELLSIDTEATVAVHTAGRRSRIRLVRSEFEELIRDAIDDTVDATRRAIASAGIAEQDIDAIVLAGGSSRIPLVAQVVSAEFSLPIVIDARPEASSSLGAAWLARDALLATSEEVADLAAAGEDDELSLAKLPTPLPDPPRTTEPGPFAVNPPGSAPPPVPAAVGPPGSPPPVSPVPSGGSGVGPAGRRDQAERHGRHRQRGIRRYWIRVAGMIFAVVAITSAGSVLAISQASDRNSPGGGLQVNAPSTPAPAPTTAVIRGGLMAADRPAATQQAGMGQSTAATDGNRPPTGGADAATLPDLPSVGGAVSSVPWVVPDDAPDAVGAPAVIMDLSALLAPGQPSTGQVNDPPLPTGVSIATP